jgi:hypothetical protein
MMKTHSIFVLFLMIFLMKVNAQQINFLNVEGSNVYFSTTTSKAASAPSCAIADTNEQYAVSLATENGRAVYSLLIMAMASGQAIDVQSAGDCADVTGLERANSVSITPVIKSAGEGKSLYLYQGDGITKLGRVVSALDQDSILYLHNDDKTQLRLYEKEITVKPYTVYFTGENCTGTAFSNRANFTFYNEHYNNGKTYHAGSSSRDYSKKSHMVTSGTCYTSSSTMNGVPIAPRTIGICGVGHCKLIEE